VTRLARRIRCLEAARGACAGCGGFAGLAVVLGDEPVPERPCPRCGRAPLVVRITETTEEQWHAAQIAGKARGAA